MLNINHKIIISVLLLLGLTCTVMGQKGVLRMIDIKEIPNPDSLEKHLTPKNVDTYLFQLLTIENTWHLRRSEKFTSRLEKIRRIALKEDRQDVLPMYYFFKGTYLSEVNKSDSAFIYLQKAKAGFSAVKDTSGLIATYNTLVFLFGEKAYAKDNKDNLTEYKFLKEANRLAVAYGDTSMLINNLVQLSVYHGLKEEFDQCRAVLNQALTLTKDNPNFKLARVGILNNYANLESAEGNYQLAYKLLKENKDLSKVHLDRYFYYGSVLLNLTKITIDLDRFDEAELYLKELTKGTVKKRYVTLKEGIFDAYRLFYERKGDYKKALIYADSSKFYLGENYKLEAENNLHEIEEKYKNEEMQRENENLSTQNQLIEKRNQVAFIGLSVSSLLLLLFIVVAIALYRSRKMAVDQAAQIKQLAHTRDNYLNIIAHDIRSPLNAISNMYELLATAIRKNQLAEIKQIADYIDEASIKTKNTVENLLKWGLGQQHEIPFQPQELNVHEIATHIIDHFSALQLIKAYKIEINCTPNTTVYADEGGLKLILRNLLDNATKSLPTNTGLINIDVVELDHEVRITIRDNGKGIAEEKLQEINELFSHEVSVLIDHQQFGMGIVLISKFVRRNKGHIIAQHAQGGGAEFVLTLPQLST